MLGELCYWIFNMSIIASLVGLFVLIIRKLKFIPHRVSVFLWIIPFVRMCIPLGLSSPYSLMTLISRLTTRTVTVYQLTEEIELSLTNSIMAANSYFPITYKVNILKQIFDVAALIWIIGALAIIIVLAILYTATKREIKDSKLLENNIFLSEKVQSPAVYGIINPRIVLPDSFTNQELKYILQHEKTHIRRRDNLWRLLGFLAAAIHWFNPFSWVFLTVFLSDLELACEEAAVAKYKGEERKEYARTLLNCNRSKSFFASAFGGARVRMRIENVLSYKEMTVVSAIGFTILILAIIVTLLTNAG
jgi:beta-lactamase regulating signal transducer with metallopeptidase domain